MTTRKLAAVGAAVLLAVTLTSCSTSKPTDPEEFVSTWLGLALDAGDSRSDCRTALGWLRSMTPPMTCEELPGYTRLPPDTEVSVRQCTLTDTTSSDGARAVECLVGATVLTVHVTGDGETLLVDGVAT